MSRKSPYQALWDSEQNFTGEQRIADVIKNQAAQEIQAEFGEWTLFEYTSQPNPRLRLFINPQGRAVATLERRPDGTLKTKKPAWLRDDKTRIYTWTKVIMYRIQAILCQRLITRAMERVGPNQILAQYEWNGINHHASQSAKIILQENAKTTSKNGKASEVDLTHATLTVNTVIRKYFVQRDLEVMTTRNLSTNGELPDRYYNHVARNYQVFQQVEHDAPNVMRFLGRHILTRRDQRPIRFKNAEHLTRTVRETIEADGPDWKILTRLGWDNHPYDNLSEYAGRIRIGAKAIRDANQPQSSIRLQAEIMAMTQHHQFYQENHRWRHGNPWRAWIHLLGQAMNHGEPPPGFDTNHRYQGSIEQTIRTIDDALRWHIINQQPWGPTDWHSYVRRSDRWHDQQRARNKDDQQEKIKNSRWDSLMQDTVMGDLTVHPVTTGTELQNVAQEMGNCLINYRTRCENGNERIFLFKEAGSIIAAGELMKVGGAWNPGQLEGPKKNHLRALPRAVNAAFKKTVQLYNELEKAQHNKTQTQNPGSNTT